MTPTLYWVRQIGTGRLAICARPRGGDWLDDELRGLRRAGVDWLVSLLTEEEGEQLDLTQEEMLAAQNGIGFTSFPIPDRGVPESQAAAHALFRFLCARLDAGQNVAVHCRQGIGRSSLVAAGVLCTSGLTPDEALRVVSQAREIPVPETVPQREWVEALPQLASLA